MGLFICSHPLPGPRAGPGPGEGGGWRGTGTAGIQQLAAESGERSAATASCLGGGKGTKPERRGWKATVTSGAEPRAMPGGAPCQAAGRRPRVSRPAARLFVLPQRAEMRAHVPDFFFFNKQRSTFPARATRPVSLRGSLCPGSAPSRCKPGAGQTKEGLHFQPRFLNGQRGSERERFLLQTCSRAPSSWVWKYISGGRGFSPPSPRRPCFRHRPRRQRQPPSPAVPPSPRSLSCPPRFPKHQEPPAPAQAGTPGPRAGPAREGRVGGRSSILHELSILILTTFQRVCAGKTEPRFSHREEQRAGTSFSTGIASFREKTAQESLFRLRKGP